MSKQTETNSIDATERLTQVATVAGAWVLTAAALLATSEKLMHHAVDHGAASTPAHGQSVASYNEPEAIRAEGARETARLPEEYDVGLRMPAVSGY